MADPLCENRLWDISNKRKSKSVIVVKSKDRGGRTKVTACAWSQDGKNIAGGELIFVSFTATDRTHDQNHSLRGWIDSYLVGE